MSDLKAGFQDFINRAREKIDPIVEDVKEKAAPVAEDIREMAAPVMEDVKGMAADLKADAAPIVGKVKHTAANAVETVKDGAEKIGSLFEEKTPGLNVDNELFDALGQKVAAQKDAAKAKAEEMHRRLQEMMGNSKDE